MSKMWFIIKNGIEVGPLSNRQLRELALTKRLLPSDVIRASDSVDVLRADSLNGLFQPDTKTSRPTPPPPPLPQSEPSTPRNPLFSVSPFMVAMIGLGLLTVSTVFAVIEHNSSPQTAIAIQQGDDVLDGEKDDEFIAGNNAVNTPPSVSDLQEQDSSKHQTKNSDTQNTAPKVANKRSRATGSEPYQLDGIENLTIQVHNDAISAEWLGRLWEERIEYESVAFSPDGEILAAAGALRHGLVHWEGVILLAEAATGRTIVAMRKVHDRPVISMAFSPDSQMLASGSNDGVVKIWKHDPPNEVSKMVFTHPISGLGRAPDRPERLFWTGNGTGLIATGGVDSSPPLYGSIVRWDSAGWNETYALRLEGRVTSAGLTRNNEIITASTYGIDMWNADTGKPAIFTTDSELLKRDEYPHGKGSNCLVSSSEDGAVIVARPFGGKRGQLNVYRNNSRLTTIRVGEEADRAVVSSTGNMVATYSHGSDVVIWDTATGAKLVTISGIRQYLSAMTFSPDDQMLAISLSGGDNVGRLLVLRVKQK
ncbi:hypothetical protein F1728_06425 [Gimesia benthica]|uniref:Uncharacterized protein n=2 Tax=Gimesia benthica TaxID=2608982 RepID=A0A6I6A8H0_9PLAN|nr:hypothetical protein F1728_06425 [Gimesia benthica]